ncbi:MAG: zinc ribbon domain-containing protein [Anaerolineales bacterium]|nr:MAG: zinc ribbon domain-containing protein [Anaerolineales bacterium]
MSERIEFTRNYEDLSTNQGFQYEFKCDRCGTGYRTRFQPSVLGTAASALSTASNIFGGFLNSLSNAGENMRSASWEKAHDEAFLKAVEEIKPDFIQCPRCTSWVCKKTCWNEKRGLCKQCAPDLGVEMAAAQASRTTEEIWAHSKVAEEDLAMMKEEAWREGVRATCPSCGKPLPGKTKFCPECGAEVLADIKCAQCGAKLAANAKFCPECGAKVEIELKCSGCGAKLAPGTKFCPECGAKAPS